MGGIPGLDLSDPKQLADFARYDLSGSRFDDGDHHAGDDGDHHHVGDGDHYGGGDGDHYGGGDEDDDLKHLPLYFIGQKLS